MSFCSAGFRSDPTAIGWIVVRLRSCRCSNVASGILIRSAGSRAHRAFGRGSKVTADNHDPRVFERSLPQCRHRVQIKTDPRSIGTDGLTHSRSDRGQVRGNDSVLPERESRLGIVSRELRSVRGSQSQQRDRHAEHASYLSCHIVERNLGMDVAQLVVQRVDRDTRVVQEQNLSAVFLTGTRLLEMLRQRVLLLLESVSYRR